MSRLDVIDLPPDQPDPAAAVPSTRKEQGPLGPRSWRWPDGLPRPESLITLAVVFILCLFVFLQLAPSKLFLNTTPAGGDMGAHVWQPWFLRHHLLPHFRLTGWAPDWYAGFPSLMFYFPLPSLMIVVLNLVLPYGVAFKLISVLGLVTLPIAAWAFGRLARFPFPGPACLAAATLPFLFSRDFTIYGGNIASTLAGEFGFSISLAAALVFLGIVARGLDTGRYRAWAVTALLVTGLCHLLPTVFAVVGAIVLTLMKGDRHRWRWTFPVLLVTALLSAFWTLAFLLRLPYATDMGYEKITLYVHNLFPGHDLWLFLMAGAGVILSGFRRQRVGVFFAIMAVLSVLVFRFAPQARLWNARVLPFWFLCLYLLAGVAVAEGASIVVELLRPDDGDPVVRFSLLAVPVVMLLGVLVWVGYPLHILPFGKVNAGTGRYTWLGITSSDKSFIPDWVEWNYSGYQSSGKARRAEYFALVKTMSDLGRTDGCGRAMWEYESELDQMGTPDALMLLPYWTNSCIGSMEGLYYESSATTPYHFLNAAELSLRPSNPVRGLNYPSAPDIDEGVRHLQMLGVKYYMALTPETQSAADLNPELRLVATSGPWPVTYYSGGTSQTKQRTWKIYEVQGSELVSPLLNQPVVMKGVAKGGKGWLTAAEAWYLNPRIGDVFYAASGPASWARVSATEANPPRTGLPPVQVDNIKSSNDSISFDVDNTGVPVLVKASYFPNWHVSGATGPYRVAPNLMIVIPTSHHVRLLYGYTPLDEFGYALSLIGVAGLVWLARAKPLDFPEPRHRRRATSRVRPPAPVFGDPYVRLHEELAGAYPPTPARWQSVRPDDNLDVWLGFPAGLDLARFHATDYGSRTSGENSDQGAGAVAPTADGADGAEAGEAAEAVVPTGPEEAAEAVVPTGPEEAAEAVVPTGPEGAAEAPPAAPGREGAGPGAEPSVSG